MPKPPKQPARNPFDPFDGPVAATLDLHGQTATQALASLESFLATSRKRHRDGLVHVITGKGKNSGEKGPVLPGRVNAALKRSPLVDAHVKDSDGGGFLVRLKV